MIATLFLATCALVTPLQSTEQVLANAAEALATGFSADLGSSGALDAHGITEFAFPRALGDVDGALRDRLLSHLIGDLGLGLIAERSTIEEQLENYYRQDGFEAGLYDAESLKQLGGNFLDNQGFLAARVYSRQEPHGMVLYAQAELWNGETMVQVWNKTSEAFVASESVLLHGDIVALRQLLARETLLPEDRERAELRLKWLQDGEDQRAAQEADLIAKEYTQARMKEREAIARLEREADERALELAKVQADERIALEQLKAQQAERIAEEQRLEERRLGTERARQAEVDAEAASERREQLLRYGLYAGAGLLVVIVIFLFLRARSARRGLLVAEAGARGVAASTRSAARTDGQAAQRDAAHRMRAVVDGLAPLVGSAPSEHQPALDALRHRAGVLAQRLEALPTGVSSSTVERQAGPTEDALQDQADQDQRLLGLTKQLADSVESLATVIRSGGEPSESLMLAGSLATVLEEGVEARRAAVVTSGQSA